jgi:hypothetical protein
MPSVAHTFNFSAGDEGFTATGGQAGSFAYDAGQGAVKHMVGFNDTTFVKKSGLTWEDLGVPAGKFVHYYNINALIKSSGGSFAGSFPGFSFYVGSPTTPPLNNSDLTTNEISQRGSYETIQPDCDNFAVHVDNQASDSDIGITLKCASTPSLPGDDNFAFYSEITVTAYYEDTALNTQEDIEVTPDALTIAAEATQEFVVQRLCNFEVLEVGGGSVSPSSGLSTVYTAPATPGTYTLRATDFYCDCVYTDAVITVGEASECVTSGIVVNNAEGNAPAAPELRLTVGGSGAVSLAATITNETTGEAFTLEGTVAGGDIILVNTLEETVLIGATDRTDLFDGLFPLLALGENAFSIEVCSGVLTNLDVYWRSRWY